MFVAEPSETCTPLSITHEIASALVASKLTICERKLDEKPSRNDFTAASTSSVAADPAAGSTVAGTPVMRSAPSERASTSAASFTDCPEAASIFTGWIHVPDEPRYQPIEPEFMTTRASTACSFTVSFKVCGNCRSTLTEATQGSFLSCDSICAVSTFRSVVPSSILSRFATSDSETCSVGSTSTLSTEKDDELRRAKYATRATRPRAMIAPTTVPRARTCPCLWCCRRRSLPDCGRGAAAPATPETIDPTADVPADATPAAARPADLSENPRLGFLALGAAEAGLVR